MRLALLACLLLVLPARSQTVGIWYSTWYRIDSSSLWADWKIPYVPITAGQPRIYDSGDPAVIDEHLAMLSGAGVDFLLLDLTNHIGTKFILDRARAVASRVRAWNASHAAKIRYAIAIGGSQWSKNPADIESEAKAARQIFLEAYGADNYFRWNGRPLLAANDQGVRAKWDTLASKPETPAFTLKWWNGQIDSASIPAARRGDYLGWAFTQGAVPNAEAMVVMPGWDNRKGARPLVSRFLAGQEGGFYLHAGWERVLARKPRMVMINSFNEFAENTGVQPCATDALPGTPGMEKWSRPAFYWDMTRDYVRRYKAAAAASARSAPARPGGGRGAIAARSFIYRDKDHKLNGALARPSGPLPAPPTSQTLP